MTARKRPGTLARTGIPPGLGPRARCRILAACRRSRRRLFLLDYDGTLVPFAAMPGLSAPSPQLLGLLGRLSSNGANDVVLISGRPRVALQRWFGALQLSLVAEHGAWVRLKGWPAWESLAPSRPRWKRKVLPLLRAFLRDVPGSLLETKDHSLALHFRKSEPKEAGRGLRRLRGRLGRIAPGQGIAVLSGHKVLEVQTAGIDKGAAVRWLLARKRPGFVLAMGDDQTDENMFRALPRNAHSVRVGSVRSCASYSTPSQRNVLPFLASIADLGHLGKEGPSCTASRITAK